ncbi:V-type proton ATPase 16 kDa proteolipid subunit, variant 2, partial [Perkinsus olseni]
MCLSSNPVKLVQVVCCVLTRLWLFDRLRSPSRAISITSSDHRLLYRYCSPTNFFLASLGIAASISLANLGAAYGTAKAGVGIACMGVMRGDLVMRSLIPVVMAGVLG